ncbi:MAG: hypothetical protein WDW38_009401 [Sanguina aurantia]
MNYLEELLGGESPTQEDECFERSDVDADVIARIETATLRLVAHICSGRAPTMSMTSRAASNISLQSVAAHRQPSAGASSQHCTSQHSLNDETQVDSQNPAHEPADQQPEQMVVSVGQRMQTRTMLKNQGAGAISIARILRVMAATHELLKSGRKATQRDLYYKLMQPPLFSNAREVNAAIQDVEALVGVSRAGLGVTCAPRGAVSGALYIRDSPMGAWQDCRTCGNSGRGLPGDLSTLSTFSFQCAARYLIIVEKDAIFQRLTEDRFFDEVPAVLITAKGFPDLATRCFAAQLMAAFPGQMRCLGLVDYNPAGVTILQTYKLGSARMGLEDVACTLPDLRWLGIRAAMLSDVDSTHLQVLTPRDRTLLPGLKTSLAHEPAWIEELETMEQLGYRADIEALYSVVGYAGFSQMLARCILRNEYI